MNYKLVVAAALFQTASFLTTVYAQELDREISNLTAQIVPAVDEANVKTVATLDFVDLQGNTSQLGRFVAEELSTGLVLARKRFTVVDRANLKKILEENRLTMTGLIEPENTKKLGQIAGVDAIITGTIIPGEKGIRVIVKVIATDTAKILAAARGEITKSVAVEKLLGEGAPFETPATTPQAAGKKPYRVPMGPVYIDVERVKNARSDLVVYVAITNNSSKIVYVFAGSPDPIGASWRQIGGELQGLTGKGSDNKNSTFWLQSVEGFTRSKDKYFRGDNLYIALAPKESSKATFLLTNNWLTGPELGDAVSLSIEFALVTDLNARGSHQTKALTLTDWQLN
jgi:TolB-like protein